MLESTKVFLDIKGFVYVLGLSPEVVVKAIEQKYKDMGINGEDYLEKIVQIPFRIPDWNVTDRGDFLTDLVDKDKIDPTYKDTIGKYKDIIQEAIERTPRRVKRFINTYICEQEIFKEKELDQTNHLILTILKFKWYDFYQNLFDESYRHKLKEIFDDENKLREELKDKKGLIEFINSSKAKKTIEEIIEMSDTQLSEYRRAGMIIPQKISEPAISREKLIELLRAEKVSEFNALRDRESIEVIDLSRANLSEANLSRANLSATDLHGANLSMADLRWCDLRGTNLSMADLRRLTLSGADLRWCDLRGADLSMANLSRADLSRVDLRMANLSGSDFREVNLSEANLSGVDLSEANLNGVDLSEANLNGVDLSGADLCGVDLSGVDLSGVNLSGACLLNADLSGADLCGADLSQGIILVEEQYYQEAKVSDADFENALISDRGFLEYLEEKGAINVPDEVSTKDDFIKEMKKRGLDIGDIEQFFDE